MRREGIWIVAGWLLVVFAMARALLAESSWLGFEDDQIWYLPVIDAGTRGKAFLEAAWFLFDPRHREYAMFTLNVQTAVLLRLFGPRPEVFLAASMSLHAFTAILVFLLARALLLPRTWAHATAIIFFASFLHSDAWRWTMASQHQHVVLLGLAAILGAIMTERRRTAGRACGGWYALALVAAALGSFCRIANLVIPGALLALIVAGVTAADRSERFRRWLPALACWLGYPLVELAVSRPHAIEFALALMPAGHSAFAHYLVLAIGSLLGLLGLDRILSIAADRERRSAGETTIDLPGSRVVAGKLVRLAAVVVFFAVGGMGMLKLAGAYAVSIVAPGVFAAASLNRFHWHYLPVNEPGDIVYLLAGLGVAAAWLRLAMEERSWAALGGWFLVAGVFLTHSRSIPGGIVPTAVPSRYFIYMTPVLLPVVAQTVREAWLGIAQRLPVTVLIPARLVRAGILLVLALANVDAFEHEAFRTRMVNVYPSYEAVRAGTLAGLAAGNTARPPAAVRILGSAPTPHRDRFQTFIDDPWDDRFIARAALWRACGYRDGFVARFDEEPRFAEGPVAGGGVVFIAQGSSLADSSGREADAFHYLVVEGDRFIANGETAAARSAYQSAVTKRPFLLRYLLGARPLSDIPLITGGGPLAPWLRGLKYSHLGLTPWDRQPDLALDRTVALIDAELAAYVRAMDLLIKLEVAAGEDPTPLVAAREIIAGAGEARSFVVPESGR